MARMNKKKIIKPGMTNEEKLIAGIKETIIVHKKIDGIIKEALKEGKIKYDLQAALREIRHLL